MLLALAVGPAAAQEQVTLTQTAEFAKQPGASALGTLLPGMVVVPGRTSANSVEISFEGWIFSGSLGPMNREGFDVAVTKRPSENMRVAPESAVVARIKTNVGFLKVETKGRWTRVRRHAWINRTALPQSAAPEVPSGPDRAEFTRKAPLRLAPAGDTVGAADSGTAARVLARAGGWTRIAIEAWVPDTVLRPNDGRLLVGVTVAEVRANPAHYVGREVQWRLQFVALQKADELRPEIPAGQTYMLARGPLPESGFVYVIVPAARVAEFAALPALRELLIRGTIRAATTKYLPNPVLDLVAVVEGLGS